MANSSSPSEFDVFHIACLENDLKKVRETITHSCINQVDADGNTALHIASLKGYTELVQLLFQYQACCTIKNKNGFTAEQVAMNDEIKKLFKTQMQPNEDSEHFVSNMNAVEWVDSFENAYKIAYENRGHMKQWLLKVPLAKLLEELKTGYIDKMEFASPKSKELIQDNLEVVIDYEQPAGLIRIYNSYGTGFSTRLNYDLAKIDSKLLSLNIQDLFRSGQSEYEAPKGLGQYIFAAILINHSYFQPHYHTGTTFRGMNITRSELAQYKEGDIVLTRSFLSTSQKESVAEYFMADNENKEQPTNKNENQAINEDERIPVVCIYKVVNPQTSLYIDGVSIFPDEKEVLIVPFAVFQVTKIETFSNGGIKLNSARINLEEVDSKLV